jgi:hypothetical protein
MEINGSTAGAVNITALVKAAAYFKNPHYLTTAEMAGNIYYERDLAKGYAGGKYLQRTRRVLFIWFSQSPNRSLAPLGRRSAAKTPHAHQPGKAIS